MNLFVGNLPYSIMEKDLRAAFEDYGQVESVKIILDRDTGRSRGYGFVEMPESDQAQAAMRELNGAKYEGRRLIVNRARRDPNGPQRSPLDENKESRGGSLRSYHGPTGGVVY